MAARKTEHEKRIAQIEEALGDAEASMRRLRLELEAERSRVVYEEPTHDSAVIRFEMRHISAGRTSTTIYSYAAIRVGKRWFTTGSTCPHSGYSWEQLWRFIAHNKLVSYEVMPEPTPATEIPMY